MILNGPQCTLVEIKLSHDYVKLNGYSEKEVHLLI